MVRSCPSLRPPSSAKRPIARTRAHRQRWGERPIAADGPARGCGDRPMRDGPYWPGGHTGWTDEGVVVIELSPPADLRPILEHLGAQLAPST